MLVSSGQISGSKCQTLLFGAAVLQEEVQRLEDEVQRLGVNEALVFRGWSVTMDRWAKQ